jgi:hypothetical protein
MAGQDLINRRAKAHKPAAHIKRLDCEGQNEIIKA